MVSQFSPRKFCLVRGSPRRTEGLKGLTFPYRVQSLAHGVRPRGRHEHLLQRQSLQSLGPSSGTRERPTACRGGRVRTQSPLLGEGLFSPRPVPAMFPQVKAVAPISGGTEGTQLPSYQRTRPCAGKSYVRAYTRARSWNRDFRSLRSLELRGKRSDLVFWEGTELPRDQKAFGPSVGALAPVRLPGRRRA
jgi:hypothetical protein